MRILQVHCRYAKSPGGEGRSADAEAALLRGIGHDVPQRILHNAELRPWQAVRNLIWPWRAAYDDIRAAITHHRAEVVWIQNSDYYGPALVRAAYDAGCAVIVALRNQRRLSGWREVWGGHNGSRFHAAAIAAGNVVHARRTWQRQVDVLVPCSEFLKRQFVAAGWPAQQLIAKPNAVWPEPAIEPRRIKRQFLFVGRLVSEKGVEQLIDAWRMLGDDAPRLRVVGDGPLLRWVESQAHQFSLPIHTSGHLPHARALDVMAESMAVIMPSIWPEPFGRVSIEALAVGTPTIVCGVGGLLETEPTIAISLEDPEAIACSVRTILKLPDSSYAEWRTQARERFERYFCATRQKEHLEWILAVAMDRRNRRVGNEKQERPAALAP